MRKNVAIALEVKMLLVGKTGTKYLVRKNLMLEVMAN